MTLGLVNPDSADAKTRQLVERRRQGAPAACSSRYNKGSTAKELLPRVAIEPAPKNRTIVGPVVVPAEPVQGTNATKSGVSADSKAAAVVGMVTVRRLSSRALGCNFRRRVNRPGSWCSCVACPRFIVRRDRPFLRRMLQAPLSLVPGAARDFHDFCCSWSPPHWWQRWLPTLVSLATTGTCARRF